MKHFFIIFIESVMYFFSVGENPIEKYNKIRRMKTDSDNIAQDWYNIGNDIRRAYESTKSC